MDISFKADEQSRLTFRGSDLYRTGSDFEKDPNFLWVENMENRRARIARLQRRVLSSAEVPGGSAPSADGSPPPHSDRLSLKYALLNLVSNASSMKHTVEDSFYTWLEEKGYTTLSQLLKKQSGEPWNSIKKLQFPILMEQLVELHLLSAKQTDRKTANLQELAVSFGLELSNLALINEREGKSDESIDDAKQVLGKLIYFIDRYPNKSFKILQEGNVERIVHRLNDEFEQVLFDLVSKLNNHYRAHSNAKLQSAHVATHTKIPLKIAEMLVTNRNTINVGIIDHLEEIFLSNPHSLLNHEISLSYALKLLQKSPKMRAMIENIHAPEHPDMESNDVVRASLGLDHDIEVTDRHAMIATLTALLSHLRQSDDISCFAISLAIEILSSHLGYCVRDLSQLLENNVLIRQFKGISEDICFSLVISDNDLDIEIRRLPDGKIDNLLILSESPGIQAACRAIGILKPGLALIKINETLTQATGSLAIFKVRNLLEELARYQVSDRQEKELKFETLFQRACFAFSSQTHQPLLKVWENAIANMAETREGGMIKAAIWQAIVYAFSYQLTELKLTPSKEIGLFFADLKALFEKMAYLKFSPMLNVSFESISLGKEGGFVLHVGQHPIVSPTKFQKIVKKLVKQVSSERSGSPEKIKTYEDLEKIFLAFVESDVFLNTVLLRYDKSNRIYKHPLNHVRYLTRTPWVTKIGNRSKTVLDVYLEKKITRKEECLLTETPEERLIKIIEMAKSMSAEEKRAYLRNPHKLAQFSIPGLHTSSLMLGHPSLMAAWSVDTPVDEWVKNSVLIPGQDIATSIITPDTRQAVMMKLKMEILPQHELEAAKIETLLNEETRIPQGLSIQSYREHLLGILTSVHSSAKVVAKIMLKFDSAICHYLPRELKEKLATSAVRFADSNWSKNTVDVHFCFLVNPGTGQLEIWETYDDGSKFIALDQKHWLIKQPWEFFILPQDILSDDLLSL